jgi:hypothetical protein
MRAELSYIHKLSMGQGIAGSAALDGTAWLATALHPFRQMHSSLTGLADQRSHHCCSTLVLRIGEEHSSKQQSSIDLEIPTLSKHSTPTLLVVENCSHKH